MCTHATLIPETCKLSLWCTFKNFTGCSIIPCMHYRILVSHCPKGYIDNMCTKLFLCFICLACLILCEQYTCVQFPGISSYLKIEGLEATVRYKKLSNDRNGNWNWWNATRLHFLLDTKSMVGAILNKVSISN